MLSSMLCGNLHSIGESIFLSSGHSPLALLTSLQLLSALALHI
jgi:hypothetical protein